MARHASEARGQRPSTFGTIAVELGGVGPLNGDARTPPALDNPHQERLYRLVEEAPGLNINELAEDMEISRGSTRYHLRRLLKRGLVVAHRHGHNRFHFASNMPVMRRRAVFLLRLPTIRALVELALADDHLRTADLADALGVSARSVRRNLKVLEKAGLLECHQVKNRRGAYDATFHPDLRIAWVLYCKDAGFRRLRPLRKAPALILGLEFLFGLFAFGSSS